MFFLKTIQREVLLDPRYLGPKLKEHVFNRIKNELEGQCLDSLGYIIAILSLNEKSLDTDNALIDNDTGAVNLLCACQVLVLRVFPKEVVDAKVSIADNAGGVFATVGPLQIFVSRLALPTNVYFDQSMGDRWVFADGSAEIKVGSILRLRITGVTFGNGRISAVGTTNESDLGVMLE